MKMKCPECEKRKIAQKIAQKKWRYSKRNDPIYREKMKIYWRIQKQLQRLRLKLDGKTSRGKLKYVRTTG